VSSHSLPARAWFFAPEARTFFQPRLIPPSQLCVLFLLSVAYEFQRLGTNSFLEARDLVTELDDSIPLEKDLFSFSPFSPFFFFLPLGFPNREWDFNFPFFRGDISEGRLLHSRRRSSRFAASE